MTLEEVRIAIKQIGKELYEDNPERQARGPFSVDKYDGPMTREQKLADVEAYQAEMLEKQAYQDALMDLEDSLVEASPSVGEKLVTDFISLYPMGKRGSAGIGSLLGKEIGGMSEAEASKIAQAQEDVVKLNQMTQEGEVLSPSQVGTESEAKGILNARPPAGPNASRETYFESLSDSGKNPTSPQMLEDFLEYQESKGRTKIGGIWFTREQWENMLEEDFSDIENLSEAEMDLLEEYNLEIEQLPKGPPKELNWDEKEMNQMTTRLTQYVKDFVAKTPLSEEGAGKEIETKTLYHRGPKGIDKFDLRPDRFGENKNALFFLNNPQKEGYGEALYKVEAALPEGSSLKLGNPPKELIKNLDAEIAQLTDPIDKEEMIELRGVLQGNKWFGGTSESRQLMRESGQVRSLTSKQSEFLLNQGIKHLESINTRGIPGFLQNTTSIVLDPDILNITGVDGAPKVGKQAGGLIMNYGDYGRNYT